MKDKWSAEELERIDGHLLVISCDEVTRGSVVLYNENESIKWMKVLDFLNQLPNAKE